MENQLSFGDVITKSLCGFCLNTNLITKVNIQRSVKNNNLRICDDACVLKFQIQNWILNWRSMDMRWLYLKENQWLSRRLLTAASVRASTLSTGRTSVAFATFSSSSLAEREAAEWEGSCSHKTHLQERLLESSLIDLHIYEN